MLVTKSSQVPNKPHYAIIVYRDRSVPGYDRDDPPDSITVCDHYVFEDKADWQNKVKELHFSKKRILVSSKFLKLVN